MNKNIQLPVDNQDTMRFPRAVLCLALVGMLAGLTACTESSSGRNAPPPRLKGTVSDGGNVISFPPGSPALAQLNTSVVKKGTALISVFAPARVVASISVSKTNLGRVVLFDAADVTSLYSQYRQARAMARLSADNLSRVKDMYNNQGATAKDVSQAISDDANARASLAETEARLRALGFDPTELESASSNRVWLMADVPEDELHEVQKGEEVDVFFDSFPDTKFSGRADAVGEILDPATRSVKVRVTLSNSGGRFLPGMYARVDFGDPTSGVVILPLSAVVTVDSRDFVFVQTGPGEYHRRPITIAKSGENEVVVLKGLEDGETVVTAGAMLLKGLSFGF